MSRDERRPSAAERKLIRACRAGQSRLVLAAVLACWAEPTATLTPHPRVKKTKRKF